MHLVLGVCDRIYVIEFGTQIANGTPDEVVRQDPAVVAAYLGADHLGPESVAERCLMSDSPTATRRLPRPPTHREPC